jgi:DnaK suppressor protein
MPTPNNQNHKKHYSDEELEEFKQMIHSKIADAQKQLEELREQMTELNETDETSKAGTFEDGASTWQREHINKLAARQQSFIRDLEYALIRIKNKTYGVCTVTGQLIEKKRLMLVPHATKSVVGKQNEQEDTKNKKTGVNPPTSQSTKKVISKVLTPKKKNLNADTLDMDEEEEEDILPEAQNLDLDGFVADDSND